MTNANAYCIGAAQDIEPLYKVAIQLKIVIAAGIATRKVKNENTRLAYVDCPLTNRCWPQPRKPSTAMATLEKITRRKPNTGLRENVETSSLTTPMAGNTMTYTAELT